MEQLLKDLIENISPETITTFFKRKISSFREEQFDFDDVLKEKEFEKFAHLQKLGEAEYDNSDELLVFCCKYNGNLSERSSKKQQYEIAKRVLKEDFKDGAIFVFYDDEGKFRFSFLRKNYGDKTQKFTPFKRYTYFVEFNNTNRTFKQQMLKCDFSSIDKIQEAFSLEALNKQFYIDYQIISRKIIREIHSKQIENKLNAHQGALNLLNRLMFVYFIQKKGWLMNDSSFIYNFWKDYKAISKDKNSFHKIWLNKIFFSAFNGKAYSDKDIFIAFPEKYHKPILNFPYLNGGLFTSHNDCDNFFLEDSVFEDIFDFLQNYNFTIDEDSLDEVSLEINPELLGKMYEGMINASDLDDSDAEHGIVYTERPEINFMTRRSFVEVLYNKFNNKVSREFLYHFCFDYHEEKIELLKRYKANTSELKEAILKITSLDPTCGSGSMLIGVIQLQVELLKAIYEYEKTPLSSKEEFKLKKQIISDCIYGVDIKEWAVRIAELRFWLYMIADAEFSTEELTKSPLLPNLDFKLRQGNSLIQEIGNVDFSIKELFKNRKRNVGSARKLNDYIKKKKAFITNQNELQSNFEKLKEEELSVFREFIKDRIKENKDEIFRLSKGDGQTSMFGISSDNNI